MAAIKYIDIRKGMVFVGEDGSLYQCLDRDLNTPGNWRAILYLKLRNLKTGSITQVRFKPDDKVDLAYLETREMQYSYADGDEFIFMDSESFEQTTLPKAMIDSKMVYLRENDTIKVTLFEGKPIDLELPAAIRMKVTETDPALKGATAAAQYKPATCETGLKLNVPPHISIGDMIEIDTETGKYMGKVKE